LDQIRNVNKSSILKGASQQATPTSKGDIPGGSGVSGSAVGGGGAQLTGLAAILADAMKARRTNIETSSDDGSSQGSDEEEEWD
jgi:hypothetical protein